jgi:hypothetical protein
MKYINFIVQTFFIVASLVFIILLMAGKPMENFFLMTQLILGLWQYAVALVLNLSGQAATSLRLYFKASSVYLFLLTVIALANFPGQALVFQLSIFFSPPGLAIYCYIVTCRNTFSRNKNNGSFLPHLSF